MIKKNPFKRNDAVKAFQHQLVKHGYTIAIDGIFSSEMDIIVRDFQATYGLDVDGLVGANTWREGLGNKNTFVQPASEFRGAWVATVSHVIFFFISFYFYVFFFLA